MVLAVDENNKALDETKDEIKVANREAAEIL
jgi:hypothetical protein